MEQTYQFDTAREAQEALGRSRGQAERIAAAFGVRLTVRDAWVKIEGEAEGVGRTADFLSLLRRARDRGVRLSDYGIVYALRTVLDGRTDDLERMIAARIAVAPAMTPVFPQTFGQHAYVQAIAANDFTFGIGPAGTGKTYLAMAMAVSALLRGEVSRIILTRPAVEAGEALGFLPGDMRQKVSPYLRPLRDALYDMMPAEEIERQSERGVIEVAPLAYMRGRTLNHAFAILDEAQNTTREQMLMFLTRMGFDSKCVITGDLTQIDLPGRQTSGLIEARRTLRGIPGIALCELGDEDVVRHELVQTIIQAYRRERAPARKRAAARDRPAPGS